MGRISDFWKGVGRHLVEASKSNAATTKAIEEYRDKARKKADKLGKLQHAGGEHKMGGKHSGVKGVSVGTKTKH